GIRPAGGWSSAPRRVRSRVDHRNHVTSDAVAATRRATRVDLGQRDANLGLRCLPLLQPTQVARLTLSWTTVTFPGLHSATVLTSVHRYPPVEVFAGGFNGKISFYHSSVFAGQNDKGSRAPGGRPCFIKNHVDWKCVPIRRRRRPPDHVVRRSSSSSSASVEHVYDVGLHPAEDMVNEVDSSRWYRLTGSSSTVT